MIEKIQCLDREAPIAELSECYHLIPIRVQDKVKWVRPSDRLLVNQATPAECNPHFGLKLNTQEGAWIQITPHPKAIPAPLQAHILNHNVTARHHLDMSAGGLYSLEELRAWQAHLEQGVTHSAV